MPRKIPLALLLTAGLFAGELRAGESGCPDEAALLAENAADTRAPELMRHTPAYRDARKERLRAKVNAFVSHHGRLPGRSLSGERRLADNFYRLVLNLDPLLAEFSPDTLKLLRETVGYRRALRLHREFLAADPRAAARNPIVAAHSAVWTLLGESLEPGPTEQNK